MIRRSRPEQPFYEQRMGARRMREWLLYRMTLEEMAALLDQSDTVGKSTSE